MLNNSYLSAIHSWIQQVSMVPVYYLILDRFWQRNFVTSTDFLCEFSASTKIYSMVAYAYQFICKFFYYLIFIYHSVFKWNLSLSNLQKKQLPDKVSFVILISVVSYLINMSLIKASVASLSGPFTYLIKRPYYSNSKHH